MSAWTQPNLGGDGAIVSLTIDDNFELRPTAYSVGIGHVWYSVTSGTVIDPAFAASAPAFVNAFTGYLGGRIQLAVGQSFLLGFWLDANANGTPGLGDRFGWASFTYNQSGISLNSSAIESTGTGIIAGTTTAVPEPSTAIFLVIGFAALIRFVFKSETKSARLKYRLLSSAPFVLLHRATDHQTRRRIAESGNQNSGRRGRLSEFQHFIETFLFSCPPSRTDSSCGELS